MYFVLNPFFYYVANQEAIENYVIIESHGEHPHLLRYNQLKPIVERYIDLNSHGVDENKKEKYILYICDQLSQENGAE